MNLKHGKLYTVLWADCFDHIRWLTTNEIKELAEKHKTYISTVGYYVGTFSGYMVFSGSRNTHEDMAEWGGNTFIPKGCIHSIS